MPNDQWLKKTGGNAAAGHGGVAADFLIRALSFIRHSSFGLLHFPDTRRTMAKAPRFVAMNPPAFFSHRQKKRARMSFADNRARQEIL
jgi:hypothetical protein